MEERKVFLAAASWCAETVARIPSEAWGEPGLGEWDIRSLVGHTSRSFSTVINAMNTPADAVGQIADPVVPSIVGGVRLSQYLRTRSFELIVHGLDIQAALYEALGITQNLAVLRGDGAQTLFSMTGRAQLPAGSSVLA